MIALRCSYIRVSTFFEVSPMYCFGKSFEKNVYVALRRCISGVLSLLAESCAYCILLVGLCATSISKPVNKFNRVAVFYKSFVFMFVEYN